MAEGPQSLHVTYRRLLSHCAGFGWVKINFLTVAGMGLLWICAENCVDNTDYFLLLQSSACTASWSFLFFILLYQQEGCGCTRMWEETQPGQVTPTDQRDIPCHMAPCSAYKTGGRRRKKGCSELWNLSSPVTVVCDRALMNICLPVRRSEFFCFVCVSDFCFPS